MVKAIMIQGTTSGAGKSFLAAGLCRLLRQDGLRAAPFKSQNMALNSFITSEGLEMGRAQVMQAEAAGMEPTVLMNPILLKPTNDTGSQVIVNGEVRGVMSAREYFAYKHKLVPEIMKAYGALAEKADVVVIEGAGSPAEINLKQQDIVNMGMAKMAKAPVLLAGDIDRGGVFASLYGTVALLEREERSRVKGLIINKFRGDIEILRPGIAMLEKLTEIPVIGTVPYLPVDIEDEDSLAPRLSGEGGTWGKQAEKGLLDIAVVRLPRISNFTDFHVLEQIPGVTLRYVHSLRELGRPDLVILPGTKNTMGDLLWLRQNGLEAAIKKLAAAGTAVIGICGGYQMLGQALSDPEGVEQGGQMEGIGLLPIQTVFLPQKVRTRVSGRIADIDGFFSGLSGAELEGYEIHMGHTRLDSGVTPLLSLWEQQGRQRPASPGISTVTSKEISTEISTESGPEPTGPNGSLFPGQRLDGAVCGNALGCYIHGLFDNQSFCSALLGVLLKSKGLDPHQLRPLDYRQYKESQYDLLAAGLRESLDLQALYRIIEEGAEE
ncbi:MAG: cobyric acid synthase [Peptococcaceae bacterium]|nr:cobyric acid synthase [Peptococcaceae bacterium]